MGPSTKQQQASQLKAERTQELGGEVARAGARAGPDAKAGPTGRGHDGSGSSHPRASCSLQRGRGHGETGAVAIIDIVYKRAC